MLKIMLCGASDTRKFLDPFREIVNEMQSEAYNYLIPNVIYWNGKLSSWEDNSRNTVKDMDLCVFLLLEKVGEITWNDELDEACNNETPFIILCDNDVFSDVNNGKKQKRLAKQHELIKKLNEMNLSIVPFTEIDFQEKLRNELHRTIHREFIGSMSSFSFAEKYLLPSIAYGVLNYLYSTDNPEQYARFVVAKYYGDIRKTVAAYGGGNRRRDGQEEKDFGVIGIMNEEQAPVFYDFVHKKLHVLENDTVVLGSTKRKPGKQGGRRAMLAAPIWHDRVIIGALTFDFFREPPKDLMERDIISIISRDPGNLEALMRNSCRYADLVERLMFN